MIDKMNRYVELGYNFKLILNHKETNIFEYNDIKHKWKKYIVHTDKDYHNSDNEHILIVAANTDMDAINVAINELGIDYCDWDDATVTKIQTVTKIPNSRKDKVLIKIF